METTATLDLRFYRKPDVLQMTGLSHSVLYKLISENAFPAPYKLSGRTVAWRSDELHEWIESRETSPDYTPTDK
ncbi:helix-turn-helix transcriptional regulator [Solemya velesiana gill symbiont]|uniref:helix-turn-helix transcriptional regulator n=1 Tax=Solemya velesiana gill symbiont TaxID=1918948 RepID=UPI000997DA61|nr:AlpA family phage regulatory protein [Solemya velesiana gill symbiont]